MKSKNISEITSEEAGKDQSLKSDKKPGKSPTLLNQKKKSNTLLALSSAALLLPAISQNSQADTPPENIKLGYRISNYQEDDTPADKTFGPINNINTSAALERYDIDVNQFRLIVPFMDQYSLAVDLQTETLSGASPWFTGEIGGQAKLVMSGASIREDRDDISVNFRYYASEGNTGVTLSRSSENDYESSAISLDGSYNINNKHTTLSGGISFSDDELKPTQGLIPVKVVEENKDSTSLYFGFGQVVNKYSVIQTGLSYTKLSGYLTDPYKYRDQRPEERNQWAWTLGYRQFIPSGDAALHADYRFYHDNWGINSHTIDLAWYQNITRSLKLIPSVRYYSQQEASFFSNNAKLTEKYYADDFRLSTYGAVTAGLRLESSYKNWTFVMSGERYKSDGHLGTFSFNEESPGLVSFTRITLGVDYEFR